jgi:excinuclease ABC subunit A
MPPSDIVIKGAREHNLRNVDVVLPRNKLICLTGVSGSGKSSLAFDTLYAEGQRRYVESLSTFARQFLGQMPKPDVDHLSGLSPSISISQKSSGSNPRSTVGTITEIYDFLRVLYARVGQGHCPECERPITAQTREQILGQILTLPEKTRFAVLAPIARQQKGEHRDLLEDLQKQGFVRARVDGTTISLGDDLSLDRQMRHDIEVVVDRLIAGPNLRGRLGEAVDTALKFGHGKLIVAIESDEVDAPEGEANGKPKRGRASRRPGDIHLSSEFACTTCGLSFEAPTPQMFSFNSPQGMCETCDGLGEYFSFDPELLVPNPKLSFADGAIALIGKWKELGRWNRHIYQGVADTIERKRELEPGTLLETPWGELDRELQEVWLYGTGDLHITYTWRAASRAKSMVDISKGSSPACSRSTARRPVPPRFAISNRTCESSPAPIATPSGSIRRPVTSEGHFGRSPRFAERPSLSLPKVSDLPINDAAEFFSELVLDAPGQMIAAEVLKEIRGRLAVPH